MNTTAFMFTFRHHGPDDSPIVIVRAFSLSEALILALAERINDARDLTLVSCAQYVGTPERWVDRPLPVSTASPLPNCRTTFTFRPMRWKFFSKPSKARLTCCST